MLEFVASMALLLGFVASFAYLVLARPALGLLDWLRTLRHEATRPRQRAYLPRRAGSRPHRCPYCHDTLADPGVTCSDCRAHSHEECHQEHGACAACGSTARLGLKRRA